MFRSVTAGARVGLIMKEFEELRRCRRGELFREMAFWLQNPRTRGVNEFEAERLVWEGAVLSPSVLSDA